MLTLTWNWARMGKSRPLADKEAEIPSHSPGGCWLSTPLSSEVEPHLWTIPLVRGRPDETIEQHGGVNRAFSHAWEPCMFHRFVHLPRPRPPCHLSGFLGLIQWLWPGVPPVQRDVRCCCQSLLPVGDLGPEPHPPLLQSDEGVEAQGGKAWLRKERPWQPLRLLEGGDQMWGIVK